MRRRLIKRYKKQKAFTLIELLAVILILGIIALIAIPTVSSVVEQSRRGAYESTTRNIADAIQAKCTMELLSGEVKNKYYSLTDGDISKLKIDIKGGNIDSLYAKVDPSSCNVELVSTYGGFCASKSINEDKIIFSEKNENGDCLIADELNGNKLVSTLESKKDECFITDGVDTILFYDYSNPKCKVEILNLPDEVDGVKIKNISSNAFFDIPDPIMNYIEDGSINLEDLIIVVGNSQLGYFDSEIDYVYLSKEFNGLDSVYIILPFESGIKRSCYDIEQDGSERFVGYRDLDYEINTLVDEIDYCVVNTDDLKNESYVYKVENSGINVINYSNATNLEYIGDYAFNETGVENVIFGDLNMETLTTGLTSSFNLKFLDLSSLTKVKKISYYEFAYSNIEEVILPPNLEEIEDAAFAFTTLKKAPIFPESLKKIGDYAFRTNKFNELKLNEGLTSIGVGAFEHNRNLNSIVEIPASVNFVGINAFYDTNVSKLIINNSEGIIGNASWGLNASKIEYKK